MDSITSILLILEFLANSGVSYRVVNNYISALKFACDSYSWSLQAFESPFVKRMLIGMMFSIRRDPVRRIIIEANTGDFQTLQYF